MKNIAVTLPLLLFLCTSNASAGIKGNLFPLDTSKPVISHQPLPDVSKFSWPAKIYAVVTDDSGLDSVWVRWFKNYPSTGLKSFRLNNTGGNNFAANFNSDTSWVSFLDSIHYRIIAQDNSSNHNRDSSDLYTFKIIYPFNVVIGTNTNSVAYPFYTYYHDSRTLLLYKASEIGEAGGTSGQIYRIGFYVSNPSNQLMNGFYVKMQNTNAQSVTGFIDTNWTTVFWGSYRVLGTGWRYINLSVPFYWSGSQNLLIDICFDNSTYTQNSTVFGTVTPGMTWHGHVDNGAGCTLTGGSAENIRPNICLGIYLLIGIGNPQVQAPEKYLLEQNYPNPFNPATEITYALPKAGDVELKIYDVLGREVATLVNEVKQAGIYTVDFNASNLASGIYFYTMKSGDFNAVKKMILVK